MNKYTYTEPIFNEQGELLGSRDHTLTEDDILELYYEYWHKMMRRAKRPLDTITTENCIEDWVMVYMAQKVGTTSC